MSEVTFEQMVESLAKPGEDIVATLDPFKAHLLHMAIGIAGEAGELLDAVKKYVIYNKEPDEANMVEELGDLEFYMEGFRQGLGVTRTFTVNQNMAKLSERYKGFQYSDKAAQERADKQ